MKEGTAHNDMPDNWHSLELPCASQGLSYRGLQRAVLETQQPKCGLTHGQGQALGVGKVGEKAPGAPKVLPPHSWARHSGPRSLLLSLGS